MGFVHLNKKNHATDLAGSLQGTWEVGTLGLVTGSRARALSLREEGATPRSLDQAESAQCSFSPFVLPHRI
jgi:hypothetical protein